MKEALLKLFYSQKKGTFLSGEKISRQLNCTRTAVWKAIEQLRQEGYRFEAVPHKGYCLLEAPDRLSAHAVKAELNTRWAGCRVIFLPVMSSTQVVAQELAREGTPEGTLVLAEQQEMGRGRLGRPWYSPEGTGIWMSLITRPSVPLIQVSQLTLVTAVAVVRALRTLSPSYSEDYLPPGEIRIKWPNDIYIRRRKVCGILTELNAEPDLIHTCVIGIGLNVNQKKEEFPPEIRQRATSLYIESEERSWNRIAVIRLILQNFENLYEMFQNEGFSPVKPLWESYALGRGTPISVHVGGHLTHGTFEGIDDDGAMFLSYGDGRMERLYTGEIDLP